MSNDFNNPNTNPKTLRTLVLTITDHRDAFESFCTPVFCDFVWNYFCTFDGAVVTSLKFQLVSNRKLDISSLRNSTLDGRRFLNE